ncbi:MAG: alpha/beta hydrolase [Chloroflexia bacterium]|nr:alpha/beta hydrolase [Chloroflexia bacterium]
METTTSVDGTTIAYQRAGRGPALLLMHDGVSDHTRRKPILPALEGRFTVYAMDRRGRGGSGDGTSYAIEREFEDIAAVAGAIGETVNLIAHSFGAVCALGAANLTKDLRTLILYEPPPVAVEGLLSPASDARLQALMDQGDRAGMVTTFMREVAAIPPRELEMLQALPSWSGRVDAAHTISGRFTPSEATLHTNPGSCVASRCRSCCWWAGIAPRCTPATSTCCIPCCRTAGSRPCPVSNIWR